MSFTIDLTKNIDLGTKEPEAKMLVHLTYSMAVHHAYRPPFEGLATQGHLNLNVMILAVRFHRYILFKKV